MTAIVGVLGGMGPLATADFLMKLCTSTPAHVEAEHIHTVTWSDPRIPDRTAALLGRGPSPLTALQRGVDVLANAGADYLAIPCNTAHAFASGLVLPPHMKFLSMIDAVALTVEKLGPPERVRVGLLATRGTVLAGLYDRVFKSSGTDLLHVSDATQERSVDRAIALVKGGDTGSAPRALISLAATELVEAGATVVLAACTEIPLVATGASELVPVIDTTQSLVDRVIEFALR